MSGRLFVEARWRGQHGIGRFSAEVLSRLQADHGLLTGSRNPAGPADPLYLSWRLAKLRAAKQDLFFSPGFNAPFTARCRSLLTVHDLIHLDVGEERSAAKAAYYQYVVRPAVRRCGYALTVSRYSAARLAQWAGLPLERITVVGNGVSSAFTADGPRCERPRPYFLYVGNRKPHKNLGRLLEAFRHVDAEADLLLSGHMDEPLRRRLRHLGLEGRVYCADALEDEGLAKLYRGAAALVIPSLYEGFGMPALEAMACGCAVIAADATSLPEITGDAALLVDPRDIAALAAAMDGLLSDASQRALLSERGLARASEFSWERVVKRVDEAIGRASGHSERCAAGDFKDRA